MNLYTCIKDEEMKKAASLDLQIAKDYKVNLKQHIDHVRSKILIDEDTILSIVSALNAGFHIILYGPPGTAKTTLAGFLPKEFYGVKCNIRTADSDWNVRKVIGGISVSYDNSGGTPAEIIQPQHGYIVEDILECYAEKIVTRANEAVFSVIDEFNRTNMDECLGPLFTALGSNNHTLRLDYNRGFNDDFLSIQIPNSYRIICTMNKYDRTFTNELSGALSRRFKWIYVGAPSADDYLQEEALVDGNIFGSVVSIEPTDSKQYEEIEACKDSPFFSKFIKKPIFDVINGMREDLELGTSYKIDSVLLAGHFFNLKLALINWPSFPGVGVSDVLDKEDFEDIKVLVSPAVASGFEQCLHDVIQQTIDAALVMTVVPACESLEDTEAVERAKKRFADLKRCSKELERMKLEY